MDAYGCSLAYAKMRLILARMIWNFDMELAPESRNWIDQLSFVVWDKPSLQVKLTPRPDATAYMGRN